MDELSIFGRTYLLPYRLKVEDIKGRRRKKIRNSSKNYMWDGYPRDQVVSAWIKEMRLRNYNKALWWFYIMKQNATMDYIAKRLFIYSCEDMRNVAFFCAASSYYNIVINTGSNDWNGAWFLFNVAFNKVFIREHVGCKHFWEMESGRKSEEALAIVEQEYNEMKDGGARPKVPEYALDMHTAVGKRQGREKAAWKYSGDRRGRLNMCHEYEFNKKLLETDDVD